MIGEYVDKPNDIANVGESKAVPILGLFLENDWEGR